MPYILLFNPRKAQNQVDDVCHCYISDIKENCKNKIKAVSDHFKVELRQLPNKDVWVKWPDNTIYARIGFINLGKVKLK